MMTETGKGSADSVLFADEMKMQKSVHYDGGSFIGAADDGYLYCGIVVFMVVSLKKSIPFVVKACPEFKITGEWVCCQMEETLETLCTTSFNVPADITDDYATNVLTFKILRSRLLSMLMQVKFHGIYCTIFMR